ncbi:hypothetical protein [Longimicrobium sp.]|uniref:hypothetical protein n=1 Tax=Longimicrobium sp. TaxID=2029185 RepID=UPI003B3A6435
MSKLKLQVESIQVVSFDPGQGDDTLQERSLRCTVDTCVVTAGIDSCWCSEYNTCECV